MARGEGKWTKVIGSIELYEILYCTLHISYVYSCSIFGSSLLGAYVLHIHDGLLVSFVFLTLCLFITAICEGSTYLPLFGALEL
jgi:hypothetical protein